MLTLSYSLQVSADHGSLWETVVRFSHDFKQPHQRVDESKSVMAYREDPLDGSLARAPGISKLMTGVLTSTQFGLERHQDPRIWSGL